MMKKHKITVTTLSFRPRGQAEGSSPRAIRCWCGLSQLTNKGFTLIEVLIALAILAISLTAIVKATSSDIDGTIRLKDTTISSLVAGNAVHMIQLGVINFGATGQALSQVTTMLGEKWYWRAELQNTASANIKKLIISVRKKADKPIITRLQAYLTMRPKQ